MDMSDNNCPERLGKFEIKRRLGRGATSHVFQAFDPFRDHDVAIKVLDPSVFEETEDTLGKTGFMVEASLVGKLDHPHIAKIYDVVAEAKQHYVVMEYVDGGTLEKYCQPGSLMDVDSAVDVIFKCGKALEYVSQLGLVHRDIKPANILLAGDTDVKVTDFGAAMSRSVSSSHHIRVGSPSFMAPEQIEDGTVDFRSDIYSLTIVLYQLLTGKRVFEASSMGALINQIKNTVPDAPSRYQPQVSRRLDDVVQKALEKKPGDRFSSWSKFLEELAATREPDGALLAIASETDRFQAVRACSFFKSFPDPALWEVLEVAEFRRVTEGDVLIRENDLGDFFFIVLSGRIRISRKGRLLDVLTPGACVGELSYVLEGRTPRSATCVAMEDGVIVKIHDEWLRDASNVCRLLFERVFLKQLSHRIIDADIRITEGSTVAAR
jgi:eukaryotic-like serine/threonine-protein kinase